MIKTEYSISLQQGFKRRTLLTSSHKELIILVHQTGGSMWVEYRLEIKPNDGCLCNVYIEDDAKYNEYGNSTLIHGIHNGIEKFIDQLNKRGIGLGGIDFYIENLSYSITDTKPAGYQYTLLNTLKRLEKTDLFKKEVLQTENLTDFFKSKAIILDRMRDSSIMGAKVQHIYVPRIAKQTIQLTHRIEIDLFDLNPKERAYHIVLSPKLHDTRRGYLIDFGVQANFEKSAYHSLIGLYDQLNEVVKTIQDLGYNLSGFYVLVIPDSHDGTVYRESSFDYIKWAILNTLLDSSCTEIREENL